MVNTGGRQQGENLMVDSLWKEMVVDESIEEKRDEEGKYLVF